MTTFAEVQAILNRLADSADDMTRVGIFARHNPLNGAFSWDSEDAFLHAHVNRPPSFVNVPLIDPNTDFSTMTPTQVKTACKVIQMLNPGPNGKASMPAMKPGTYRTYATEDDIAVLVAYVQGLPKPPR